MVAERLDPQMRIRQWIALEQCFAHYEVLFAPLFTAWLASRDWDSMSYVSAWSDEEVAFVHRHIDCK